MWMKKKRYEETILELLRDTFTGMVQQVYNNISPYDYQNIPIYELNPIKFDKFQSLHRINMYFAWYIFYGNSLIARAAIQGY